MYCIKCGNVLAQDANYCGKCGHPTNKPQDVGKEVFVTQTEDAGTISLVPEAEMKTKSQSWLSSTPVYVLYLTFFGLAFVGNAAAILLSHTPPKGINGLGLSFWCGITTAIIARRRKKSGWLWFFIGLIPIGFSIYFVLVFFRTLLFHH